MSNIKQINEIKIEILKKAKAAMDIAVKKENSTMVAAIAELLKNY